MATHIGYCPQCLTTTGHVYAPGCWPQCLTCGIQHWNGPLTRINAEVCPHGDARPVVDCPTCGRRGIARCACSPGSRCPAHAERYFAEMTSAGLVTVYDRKTGSPVAQFTDQKAADAMLSRLNHGREPLGGNVTCCGTPR